MYNFSSYLPNLIYKEEESHKYTFSSYQDFLMSDFIKKYTDDPIHKKFCYFENLYFDNNNKRQKEFSIVWVVKLDSEFHKRNHQNYMIIGRMPVCFPEIEEAFLHSIIF